MFPTLSGPDPVFLAGMKDTVRVLVDQNADGHNRSLRGGVSTNCVPVPGLDAVKCRVVPIGDVERDVDHKRGATTSWVALFPRNVGLNQNHVLVYVSPLDGLTHNLWVQGQPRAEGNTGHHWVAELIEYVA